MTIYDALLLIYLHLIADFMLQSRKMGKMKSNNFLYLSAHCAVQFLVFFAAFAVVDVRLAVMFSGINALIHGVVDFSIWRVYKFSVISRYPNVLKTAEFNYWDDMWFYRTIGIDQFLHVSTLFILFLWVF